MDSSKNEKGPPPSFYTATPSTISATDATSDTSQISTVVALPTKALQTQGLAAAATQSSDAVPSKIPHNTSPIASFTASNIVSNTVLAVSNTVLDTGGEIGASGGGVAGLGGGPNNPSSGFTMPTMASSSMEKSDTLVTESTSGAAQTSSPKLLRPAVFDKLEQLVRDMQDDDHGVPVRSITTIFSTIPAAFMGYDLIEWLMDRLSIEDSLEAVHLANLLCQFGYYFPVNELKNLLVKDDSSLYRFQTPYYWPSQSHTPDNIEYAMYLYKRAMKNRGKTHGLEDYEVEAHNNLKKILANKWEFLTMQADEQLRLAKDRKKGDKIVSESQEKAYWRVYRPPPGFTTVVENSPVPSREQRVKARNRTYEHLAEELQFLRNYCTGFARSKVSVTSEQLIDYAEKFLEFDAILTPVSPSSPWVSDDQSYWLLNQSIVDLPTEKRVRRWGISLENLMTDPLGAQELLAYMKKEYCHENLRFWLAVQDLRYGPGTEAKIRKKVKEIWDEFLSTGAKAEINIDGKTFDATRAAKDTTMKGLASRFTYDMAADHVYKFLLKNDCYPRYIRSESYKTLLSNALDPGKKKKPIWSNPFAAQQKKKTLLPPTAQESLIASNTTKRERITWEEFNIYGADAADSSSSQEGNDSPRKRAQGDENVCPWEGNPADDTSLNVSSSGRHAKESPEVGAKGASGSSSSGKPVIPRRGSDPTLLATANKSATPPKIGNSGNGGGGKPVSEESKSSNMSFRPDQSIGSIATSSGVISGSITSERSVTKKPSCKSRHHHHHQHGIAATSITARAVLAPSAIENSLSGRPRMHQGKRDETLSTASAISSAPTVIGGALVDPGAPAGGSSRIISGNECGKDFLQHREPGTGTCGTFSSSSTIPATSPSGHHHHHHHHHHHSSGASRRTKNRSKRKKTSKGTSVSSVAYSGAVTSDIPVTTGSMGEMSLRKTDDTIRGLEESKTSEGSTVAKHHPKPHHQHSTSSLLSSSVRVPASLLGSVAQSIDGGTSAGSGTSHARKGSTNTGGISSAAASVAVGMVPPSLTQLEGSFTARSGKESKVSIIEQPQVSHASQQVSSYVVTSTTEGSHTTLHSPGQHHHHRHHHHGHVHGHGSEGQQSSFTSESSTVNIASTTTTFPGTSSKCTQTKLEDEEDTLIPTSPTLARQSPMLVGGCSTIEDIGSSLGIVTSGAGIDLSSHPNTKSNTSIEESLGKSGPRISHQCYSVTSKQQGTSPPLQSHFISKKEPTLSSEHDFSKVPVYSSSQNIAQPIAKTEEVSITTMAHGETVRDMYKDGKPCNIEEIGKERESIQHSMESDTTRGRNLKLDDSGPGPPTERLVEGDHGNQQLGNVAGYKPKLIAKEALQEEGACSVPKPGDKTTADTHKSPEDGGGAGSSATTQTAWKSSTEVCPWEDEENRTDSHQPFIKTYATLGFL